MSFLFPLYLAGAIAVGLPIILHLIRRQTKEHVAFSSLMFLSPTPPKIKSKKQLENWPLLLLRCLLILLLALGFSRPFLDLSADLLGISEGKRITVVVDVSASMQRDGLWGQATNKLNEVINNARPADHIAIIAFGTKPTPIMTFEQWAELAPTQRTTIAKTRIDELTPGWTSTDLGAALIAAVEAIEDDEVDEQTQQQADARKIVLITDLQSGSRLESLQAYAWPERVDLEIHTLEPEKPTNAGMQLIVNPNAALDDDKDARPRVRVTNSADSDREQFQLHWSDDTEKQNVVDIYVPPGQSRVVTTPARASGVPGDRLILTGDDHDFDNELHIAPHLAKQINILYLGNDRPDDANGSAYYTERAFQPTRQIQPRVTVRRADSEISGIDLSAVDLIIVADTVVDRNIDPLKNHLNAGKTVMSVIRSPESAITLARILGIEQLACEEADVDDYAMMGNIDLEHPVLAPFSDPRFGDFTKIHFWKYRKLELEKLTKPTVVARFDNGDPYIIESTAGNGTLLILTAGWHPTDSQLARSSKFVPLMYSIMEARGGGTIGQAQFFVGDAIELPEPLPGRSLPDEITKPDGTVVANEGQTFSDIDLPGVYTAGDLRFAVNLAATEAKTGVMPIEKLEQHGVKLEQAKSEAEAQQDQEAKRHAQFVELENRQKIWRWLIVIAFVTLIAETLVAAKASQGRPAE